MKDTKCNTKFLFFFAMPSEKKKFLTVLNYNKMNRISGNHATDNAEHFMILFFLCKGDETERICTCYISRQCYVHLLHHYQNSEITKKSQLTRKRDGTLKKKKSL